MHAREVLDDRYELTCQIGAGGMATIWKARDLETGRQVALKVLHEHLLDRPRTVERFIREARAAREAKLSGHVIEVLDVVHQPGRQPYQVMEYLDGEDLDRVLEREVRLDPHRAVELTIQLCKALAEVHRRGLIHRDIKPENVFVTRLDDGTEWVKLLDFGVVKYSEGTPVRRRALTTVGSTVGTPYYMAPEQAKGQAIDHRIDQYATGVVLYEMLTGRLPFDDEDHRVAMQKIVKGPPPPLRSHRPEIDSALERAVLRAMATRREARFDSMADFAEALAPFSLSPEKLERSDHGVATPEHGGAGNDGHASLPTGGLELSDETVVDSPSHRGHLFAVVGAAAAITAVALSVGGLVAYLQCAGSDDPVRAELISGSTEVRDGGLETRVRDGGGAPIVPATMPAREFDEPLPDTVDGGADIDRARIVETLRSLAPDVQPCLEGSHPARTKVLVHFSIGPDGVIRYRKSRPRVAQKAERCLRKALAGRRLPPTGAPPRVATYPYTVPR